MKEIRNNIGNCNIGDCNLGDRNLGNNNHGNDNVGDHNKGDHNVGYHNIGDYNVGDYNKGYYNIGDFSIGCFNTIGSRKSDKRIRFFDKESSWTMNDWSKSKAKTTIDNIVTNDLAWEELSEEDKNEILSIPNFDPEKFYMCTGISAGYIKNDIDHIMNYLVENHFETEIENFLKGLDPKNKIELNTLYNEMVESLTKIFKEYSEEHY